jgi:hypothetical protein
MVGTTGLDLLKNVPFLQAPRKKMIEDPFISVATSYPLLLNIYTFMEMIQSNGWDNRIRPAKECTILVGDQIPSTLKHLYIYGNSSFDPDKDTLLKKLLEIEHIKINRVVVYDEKLNI